MNYKNARSCSSTTVIRDHRGVRWWLHRAFPPEQQTSRERACDATPGSKPNLPDEPKEPGLMVDHSIPPLSSASRDANEAVRRCER